MTDVERSARFCETTGHELLERLDVAAARFLDVARSVDPGSPVPDLTWDARTLVAHVLTVVYRYTRRDPDTREGLAGTIEEVTPLNQSEAAAVVRSHTHDEVLALLGDELEHLRGLYDPATLDLYRRYPFHVGATIDAAGAGGNLIGELLVHGLDLARAARRPWSIDDRDAELMLNGWFQIIPSFVNRDYAARRPLDLRLMIGGARPWAIVVRDGVATSGPAGDGGRPDSVVRVPASTMVLAATKRLSTAAAVRRGMRVVGGRRPWRVLRMNHLFHMP